MISNLKGYYHLASHLPRKLQLKMATFTALTLFGAIVETFSIGIVVPFLALITNPSYFETYNVFISKYSSLLVFTSRENLILFISIIFLLIYILKNLYLVFQGWYQAGCIQSLKFFFSTSLYTCYINSPYPYIASLNSGQLIRNISTETQELVSRVFVPFALLISEFFVVSLIVTMLIFLDPIASVITISLLIFSILFFHLITKNKLQKWGINRQYFEGKRLQTAQEGLAGIKEVNIYCKHDYFIKNYKNFASQVSLFERKQQALSIVPRLWIEIIGVTALVNLVIFNIFFSNNSSNLILYLGLFAAVAFRLLPSSSRILDSIQSLKYSSSVVDLVNNELNFPVEHIQKNNSISFLKSIELKNITFKYESCNDYILNNLNLTILKGDCIGIVGSSGSGKSTLIDLIMGLYKPSFGSIFFDGQDIAHSNSFLDYIGYIPQKIFVTDASIKSNIAFGLEDSDIDNVMLLKALEASQLSSFIATLPDGMNTIVGERGMRLSGGQLQRIGIARALYRNPSLLIMDEATSALDGDTEKDVVSAISLLVGSITILVVAHRLSTLKHCDRVFELKNGILNEFNLAP